jgi:hypothetical protein
MESNKGCEKKDGESIYNDSPSESKEITFLVTNNLIVEEIYRQKRNEYLFAVYDGKSVTYQETIQNECITYMPLKSGLMEKGVVLLPSGVEEYDSTADLLKEIRDFIHKYYEYPTNLENLDSYYVLHTWNYDKFAVTPYRRILGDYGTGKTRFLKVVGSICYKPTFISSASSEASIYRMIDVYNGTLIIDEADFISSTLYSTITKILNSGYQKGSPIIKCHAETFEPEAFNVFCPKIIASRQRYGDEALESRCITSETEICTRDDIPKSLTSIFRDEALSLRNKLLLYKFRNFREDPIIDKEFDALPIEPRLKEIMLPLASIIDNSEVKKQLIDFVLEYQNSLIRERNLGVAKLILEAIIVLKSKEVPLAVGTIALAVEERLGYNGLSARKCGAIIKKELGLRRERKEVFGNVPIVVIWDEQKIRKLCPKYGIDFNDLTSLISKWPSNNSDEPIQGFVPIKPEEKTGNPEEPKTDTSTVEQGFV